MNDNQKSSGVFDKDGLLTFEQKKKLREMLRNTKSLIWDIVLSFEKEYEKKHVFNYQQTYDLLNYVLPKLFKDAGFGVITFIGLQVYIKIQIILIFIFRFFNIEKITINII